MRGFSLWNLVSRHIATASLLFTIGAIGGADLAYAQEDPAHPEVSTSTDASEAAEEADTRSRAEIWVDAQFGKVVQVMYTALFLELGAPQPTLVPHVDDPNLLCVAPADAFCENGKPRTRRGFPFVVLWLFCGAIFFTFAMRFINIRGFVHAINVVRGKYDKGGESGEVSHFQALSSALSATVGLGNIAGVAIAVSMGGPGAIFWMIVAALLGMTSKFVECTLGVKYRHVAEDGTVLGGPMVYLKDGLAKRGFASLGAVLAVVFAVFCIGGSFGGGNMFQANQAYAAFSSFMPFNVPSWAFGIAMMIGVGAVILGGIKRIAATAARIVPLMCSLYVMVALFIVVMNITALPAALGAILNDAFTGNAMCGGVLGVLIMGIQRAAFSNEAGIGSASIAHSAAKTDEPVREGLVALLEPFIDTVIVCLATALVIVISGVLDDPAAAGAEGAVLTAMAFQTVISWFPVFLTIAIILFAYSTMISWSYYGERCWVSLFGSRSAIAYRVIFLGFIFVGSVSNLGAVLDFSDLMILSMAFPNILGLYILTGEVRRDLDSYMGRLRRGEFDASGS